MKKIILSVILIFFVSLSTSRVYGYYEDSSTQYISTSETYIKITEKVVSSNGMNLIPTGAIAGENDIEEIVYTYTVFVQDGVLFGFSIQNIMLNSQIATDDIKDVFEFDFELNAVKRDHIQVDLFDESIEGNYFEITVTLSMNFPTQEQYLLLAGGQLEFEFYVES